MQASEFRVFKTSKDPVPPDQLVTENDLPPWVRHIILNGYCRKLIDAVIDDMGDGWTTVYKNKAPRSMVIDGIAQPMKDLTLRALQADYTTKSRVWRQSSCRKEILAILDKQKPEASWNITEAICLATNSFSRDNWTARQRSMTQFVAFLDIADHLRGQQDCEPGIYAQEPLYTALDIQFLSSKGVVVLGSPQPPECTNMVGLAGDHITDSSFVFEPYMDLKSAVVEELLRPGPILYIGTCFERAYKHSLTTDEEIMGSEKTFSPTCRAWRREQEFEQYKGMAAKLAKFCQSWSRYNLPTFEEDPNIFEGLQIAWKKADDEDAD